MRTSSRAHDTTSVETVDDRGRLVRSGVISAIVVVAGAWVALSAFSTTSATVSASTEGTSFITAGTVEIDRADGAVDLVFDADGLYPGLEVTGCVDVVYRGSLPATVRLHAGDVTGTGLDRFLRLRLWAGDGRCDEERSDAGAGVGVADPGGGPVDGALADVLLADLVVEHHDFASGLPLLGDAEPGDRIAVTAVASVVDDNAAQGLTTEFSLTIEARP